MKQLIIEISSYPKSGNTWMRHIFREVLRGTKASRLELASALHQVGVEKVKALSPIEIPELNLSVKLYKSHICSHPAMNPDRILYAYRHPLDVLFSALNFHATQALVLEKKIDRSVFLKSTPKLVEDIIKDGDLSFYFDRFLEDAGASLFSKGLTGANDYFDHVIGALENKRVTAVKYEDMCSDVSAAIEPSICKVLGIGKLGVDINYNYIDKNTKDSNRKDFFWKASSGGYLETLSLSQIERFNSKYSRQLIQAGYLN